MSEQNNIEKCQNCNSNFQGNYCSQCGSAKTQKRINGKYILAEIRSILNFEKGILHTIAVLITRPGLSIKNYIHEDRTKLVKPIVFIIICSLVYTLFQQYLHFENEYNNSAVPPESAVAKIFEWIQNNYGYANIIMALFIAVWIKVLFNKFNYNIFEIIVLLCFVMGIAMLIYTIFGIVDKLTQFRILHVGGIVEFIYVSWGIGQFFGKSKKINYLKGALAYLLGMVTFFFGAAALGIAIDKFI